MFKCCSDRKLIKYSITQEKQPDRSDAVTLFALAVDLYKNIFHCTFFDKQGRSCM